MFIFHFHEKKIKSSNTDEIFTEIFQTTKENDDNDSKYLKGCLSH